MDIGDTLTPNSDGITNFDLIGGPRVITIVRCEVKPYEKGKPKNQQYPVSLYTAEFGEERPYRPNLTMRRLLSLPSVWGGESAAYVGRRIELFRDDTITIGSKSKPGVRISRLSHIPGSVTVVLPENERRDITITIQPLPDTPTQAPVDTTDDVARAVNAAQSAADVSKLDAILNHARSLGIDKHADVVNAIETRKKELE